MISSYTTDSKPLDMLNNTDQSRSWQRLVFGKAPRDMKLFIEGSDSQHTVSVPEQNLAAAVLVLLRPGLLHDKVRGSESN